MTVYACNPSTGETEARRMKSSGLSAMVKFGHMVEGLHESLAQKSLLWGLCSVSSYNSF